VDDTTITQGGVVVTAGAICVPSPLAIADGIFSTQISLLPGVNSVTVTVTNAAGGTANASIQLICNEPSQELWTELTWDSNNTDVDLHLVNPGASLFDFSGDCFFADTTPVWSTDPFANPILDIDNTWGYGPENITIANDPPAGTYALWAEYFRGAGTTNCMVTVVTNAGMTQFGPFALNYANGESGDAYHVCDITFPGRLIAIPSHMRGPIRVAIPQGIRKKK
jgi:uncharacterized protein YfaP (DUF2135 family)